MRQDGLKKLTTEQKANRRDVCLDLLDRLKSQNSSIALSQVMNHGFWITKPRQNAKVGSGTLQTLSVPRKREEQNQIDAHLFFHKQGIVHK